MDDRAFTSLENYLHKVPAIMDGIAKGTDEDGLWWVKFSIDINNKFAWHVVQELGHVLNYISVNERLPSVFMPVSPPPYMNGGPEEFLSWVIESKDKDFKPGTCAKWLEERLPKPVDDLEQWSLHDDD